MLLLSSPVPVVSVACTLPMCPEPGVLTLVRPADAAQHVLRLRRVLAHLRDGTTGRVSDLAAVLPWYVPTAQHFTGTAIALLWADTLRRGHGMSVWVSVPWAARHGGTLRTDARALHVIPPRDAPRGEHVYNLTAFDWAVRPEGLRLSIPRVRRASWTAHVDALRAHAPAVFTHAAALADYSPTP